MLGITIDDKLKFDKHIDIPCKSAARQINVLYRFRGIFDIKEREVIHNTFILANCPYCPLVCDTLSTRKIEIRLTIDSLKRIKYPAKIVREM